MRSVFLLLFLHMRNLLTLCKGQSEGQMKLWKSGTFHYKRSYIYELKQPVNSRETFNASKYIRNSYLRDKQTLDSCQT